MSYINGLIGSMGKLTQSEKCRTIIYAYNTAIVWSKLLCGFCVINSMHEHLFNMLITGLCCDWLYLMLYLPVIHLIIEA